MMIPVINRRSLIILLSSTVIVLIAVFGLALAWVLTIMPGGNTISPGISVNGIYVGGLTGPQAVKLLKQSYDESSKNGHIKLQDGREKWVIPYNDLGVTYDFYATADKALKIGENGSVIKRAVEMVKIYVSKPDIPLHYYIDYDKLDRKLAAVASDINISAENASICLYNGKIKILPAVNGRTLNISSVRRKIEDALGRLDTNSIILDIDKHIPEFTSESLKEINASLGIGMSDVSPSKPFRYAALKSAVTMLNGILLEPGKEFSFNQTAGRNLKELIYRYGTVIQRNGKPVFANSGGTSQAASTLYQAVLNSGLKVTERYAHILPPAGISPGQDAAVVMDKLDFKFINNTKYPIYILAEVKDNRMIVNLLGVKK